jgi:hypothetical protein
VNHLRSWNDGDNIFRTCWEITQESVEEVEKNIERIEEEWKEKKPQTIDMRKAI